VGRPRKEREKEEQPKGEFQREDQAERKSGRADVARFEKKEKKNFEGKGRGKKREIIG